LSSKGPTLVGAVVAVLIIVAVATLGYYQFAVAPGLARTTTTSSQAAVVCPSAQCVSVSIPNGASTPPAGYSSNSKTKYGYAPLVVTVVIGKNNTVQWTNNDVSIHTATSDTAGAFDSGNIAAGASAQFTFTAPGTYNYHCVYHAWMLGTIIVKSA
jgi:plastocyanin